ncbi:MAG: replication-relaxation family protein [Candidatus Saccharimonadales bacterium]
MAILADVAKVRVLTGRQVERLHFAHLGGMHRDRTRRRVLERLAAAGLLTALPRRVGGGRAGSAGMIFALGLVGQRWLSMQADGAATARTRQPGVPTERFLAHTLVVAELYVSLTEASRTDALTLNDFRAEPAAWWRDSEGEWVKPDALAVVSNGDVEDSWAIEVDQATESLPTLRRKLAFYLDLARNEEHGPNRGPLPRVLITVPDERRRSAVGELLRSLPEPAGELFVVTVHSGAIAAITEALQQ